MGNVLVDRNDLLRVYLNLDGPADPNASDRVRKDRTEFLKHIMEALLAQADVPDPECVTVKRVQVERLDGYLADADRQGRGWPLTQAQAIVEDWLARAPDAPTPPAPLQVRQCNTCCQPYVVGEAGSTDQYCHRCAPGEAELAARQSPEYVTREELRLAVGVHCHIYHGQELPK